MGLARFTLGLALVHRDSSRGARAWAGGAAAGPRHVPERALLRVLAPGDRRVGRAGAGQVRRSRWCSAQMRAATNDLFRAGQQSYGIPASGFSVDTLLERGTQDEVAEAEAVIDRLAACQRMRV